MILCSVFPLGGGLVYCVVGSLLPLLVTVLLTAHSALGSQY